MATGLVLRSSPAVRGRAPRWRDEKRESESVTPTPFFLWRRLARNAGCGSRSSHGLDRPASIYGLQLRNPQRLFYDMATFDSPDCLATIEAGRLGAICGLGSGWAP